MTTSEPKRESNKTFNYDTHTIYAKTGVATEAQIRAVVEEMHRRLEQVVGRRLPTTFNINVVTGKGGILIGFTYIWVSNSEVYYAFVGKNLDGSERIKWVFDETYPLTEDAWMGNEEWLDKYQSQIDSVEDIYLPNGTWLSDYEHTEDSWQLFLDDPEFAKKPVRMEPLVPTLGYMMTPAQKAAYQTMEANNRNPDHLVGPGRIFFLQATFKKIEPGFSTSTLKASRIPRGITAADLKAVFQKYVSSPQFKYGHKVNGVLVQESYPVITFATANDRDGNVTTNVFVKFNPQSNDAGFAQLMQQRTIIRKNGKDEVLHFSHAPQNGIPM